MVEWLDGSLVLFDGRYIDFAENEFHHFSLIKTTESRGNPVTMGKYLDSLSFFIQRRFRHLNDQLGVTKLVSLGNRLLEVVLFLCFGLRESAAMGSDVNLHVSRVGG